MKRLLAVALLTLAAGAFAQERDEAREADGEVTLGGGDGASGGPAVPPHVVRAHFTGGVDGREPRDRLDRVESSRGRVYYFTELRGLAGRTIAHRWEYQGRLMAEVRHHVDAERWRAWSSKRLLPQWSGEWSVSVVDEEGDTLHRDTLLVSDPAE